MKKSVQIYAAGRIIILYKSGLLSWSFSIDGQPAGRSYLTKQLARRAAIKNAIARKHDPV